VHPSDLECCSEVQQVPRPTAFGEVTQVLNKYVPGSRQSSIEQDRGLAREISLAALSGPYNDSIPASVHLADSGCDQGTCNAGSYPWLEMAWAPVGKLTYATTDTSNPFRVGTSCCFTPTVKSPNPEAVGAPAARPVFSLRSEERR